MSNIKIEYLIKKWEDLACCSVSFNYWKGAPSFTWKNGTPLINKRVHPRVALIFPGVSIMTVGCFNLSLPQFSRSPYLSGGRIFWEHLFPNTLLRWRNVSIYWSDICRRPPTHVGDIFSNHLLSLDPENIVAEGAEGCALKWFRGEIDKHGGGRSMIHFYLIPPNSSHNKEEPYINVSFSFTTGCSTIDGKCHIT